MPTPAKYLVGRKTDFGVTNIRNPNAWRKWPGCKTGAKPVSKDFHHNFATINN
jgi:hypothetical protein